MYNGFEINSLELMYLQVYAFSATPSGRAMALIYVKQSVWEADFILTLGLISIQ